MASLLVLSRLVLHQGSLILVFKTLLGHVISSAALIFEYRISHWASTVASFQRAGGEGQSAIKMAN